MTDLLDRTVAEIRAAELSVEEARRLLAAEKAGKTRKMVVAHLEAIIKSAPVAAEHVVTAKGAGRIHKRNGVFYDEGEPIEGAPEAIADLIRRGFVTHV